MAATAVTGSNELVFGEKQLLAEYNKLIKLRDEVFAKQGVQVQVSKPSSDQGNARFAMQHLQSAPVSQAPNGSHKPFQISNKAAIQANGLHLPNRPSNLHSSTSPNVQKLPTPAPNSSGLDPIFLQKSDVLVRAELEQKRQRAERAELEQRQDRERQGIQQQRQRIERVLQEQNAQKERRLAMSQDALPDFDATEVLRKAHELVKPTKLHESNRANGTASSSDSFDENTFYSSQMEESTTTEEVDESRKADQSSRVEVSHNADETRKKRAHQLCNFFRKGVRCKFGEGCVFSHDPALKQKLRADGPQAVDLDSVNADEQTNSRNDNASSQRGQATGSTAHPQASPTREDLPTVISDQERLLQERVDQLEAELRRSLASRQLPPEATRRGDARDHHDSQEESAYSPPPPDEFGRDVALREPVQGSSRTNLQQPPPIYAQPLREYSRRNGHPSSPNNMRIVQNNLPSPVAPQPQRVSPLAVAKAPQVVQYQRNDGENRFASDGRTSDIIASTGPSPNIVQPSSSRKRRRGRDSGEETRNVFPRRGNDSPAVRIKAEAVSPPTFASFRSIREKGENPEQPRQFHVEAGGPRSGDQVPSFQQPRIIERFVQDPLLDNRRPITPLARRVVSRNGQDYIANGEPDLRRVVSARQVRAPMSPAPYPVQYSAPQQRTSRGTSQVFDSPAPQQYRTSVQPQPHPPAYAINRSPSPVRRMPQSPVRTRHSFVMAPPPRRIVVDQYGNQFEEVSVPRERQVSLAPIRRDGDYDSRYAQVVPRSASVRQSQYVDSDEEGQYIRRAPSPTSPTYVGYPQPNRSRQVVDTRDQIYEDDPYSTRNDGSRVIEYADSRPPARYVESQIAAPRYEEVLPAREGTMRMHSVRPIERQYEGIAPPPPQEGLTRMQSVRPLERQYDMPQERIQRVQSVRPQPRIVSLGEKESRPQVIRQVSVRPETSLARQAEYVPNERQRYQYGGQAQEGGYVDETEFDGGAYESQSQSNGGRRVMQQRM